MVHLKKPICLTLMTLVSICMIQATMTGPNLDLLHPYLILSCVETNTVILFYLTQHGLHACVFIGPFSLPVFLKGSQGFLVGGGLLPWVFLRVVVCVFVQIYWVCRIRNKIFPEKIMLCHDAQESDKLSLILKKELGPRLFSSRKNINWWSE